MGGKMSEELATIKADAIASKAKLEAQNARLDEFMAEKNAAADAVLEKTKEFIAEQDTWFEKHKADRAQAKAKFDEEMAAIDARIAALKAGRSDIFAQFEQNVNEAKAIIDHIK